MDDMYGFLAMLEKNKDKNEPKNVRITQTDFEHFKVEAFNDGIISIAKIADIYKWCKDVLRNNKNEMEFIIKYDKNSPHFWLKDIDKSIEDDEDDKSLYYEVGLDLEDFLESKHGKESKIRMAGSGSYIPDNYELAEIVIKDFNKINSRKFGSKKFNEYDNSFREFANWRSNDPIIIKQLGDYIHKKYVLPRLKKVFKINNIKSTVYTETTIDFIYNNIKTK